MMSAHKSQSNAVREVAPGVSFRVENDFYSEADALRLQVENAFLGDDKVGITPLTYVFSESCYQFLTASAESVFTTESLHGLVESLENWGQRELGTSHVSTPQVRVYIHGCERSVLQDAVMLGWHYMLSLTQGERPRKGNRVRIVIPDRPERRGGLLSTCDVVDSELRFNRLVVHDTQNAYGIETVHSSMNPFEGTIFLDGYLW